MEQKQSHKGLYKRGKYWWFTYSTNGLQLCRSTKSTSLEEAKKIRSTFIENLNRPMEPMEQLYLFDFVVLKFLEEKKRILKEGTFNNYKNIIRNLLVFFTKKEISTIKKIDIKNYENYRLMNSLNESYLIEELKLLKNIFNFALENDLLENNLFSSYNFNKIYKNYEPRERFLTPEECQLLINNCNPYLQRLVIALLETGMRINEALNLLFTDLAYNEQSKVIFAKIRKEVSKSKRERFIPLSKIAMEEINK